MYSADKMENNYFEKLGNKSYYNRTTTNNIRLNNRK